MLSTDEFVQWSRKVVLFLHNTSRVDGEKHPNLLFEMGGVGFPTMSYLDADGRLLQQVGHVTPVAALEKAYGELAAWRALRTEVAGGKADAGKVKELFLLELKMGNRPYAEMQQRRDQLSLTDDELGATEQPLVNLQFTEILRRTPRDQQAAGGAEFLPMFRAGRIPATTTETSFWQCLFAHAAAENNVPLFEELLAWVKEHRAGDRRLARYLPDVEAQLEQLKQKQRGG